MGVGKADSGSSFVQVPSVRVLWNDPQLLSSLYMYYFAVIPTESIRGDSVPSRKLYFVYREVKDSLQTGRGQSKKGQRRASQIEVTC